ncbi:hypothetical protein APSETT444_002079 [Aspergillus pseudonomiae]
MANGDQSFYELGTSTFPTLNDAQQNALWFKCKAIQEISYALNEEKSSKQDTVVASAFLLIFLDLLESGSDKWNVHLEGVKKMITQIQPSMASQTSTEQSLGETVEGIRNFIIRQIYLDMLAGSDPLDRGSLESYIDNVSRVLDITQGFDCRAWVSDVPQLHTYSTHDTDMLSTLAEAYKAGTLIYGIRVRDALTGDTTPVNDLLCALIALIEAMRCDEALFKCMLWPMFVAGLESRQQDQRDFVISCLEKFWFETKCINVVNAANILRRFWKMDDTQQTLSSQWIFNIGQLGRDWLLI